jgi:thioredoxin 1
LLAGKITEVNDDNFEQEVLKSDIPALVDFWAPWCAPCIMMQPVLEEAASEWDGKIKICKLNVDDAMQVARSFMIQSIPTMILFDKGEPAKKIIGARPKRAFAEEFESWL